LTEIINHIAEISDHYNALFVDLWGCVHNGRHALPEAVAALETYRQTGGTVILVTNSPRTRHDVTKQLAYFGVPPSAWDSIATSGDSARAAMFRGVVGEKVWFIGTPEDAAFFKPLQIIADPVQITRVDPQDAQGIVCTGPLCPQADPFLMEPDLKNAQERGLKFLCANPDIVVDRGSVREWCAGALAQIYSDLGGQSLYFGKPFAPIYDLARRRLAPIRPNVSNRSILAIGDGISTDILGAINEGIDCLFVAGGLAATETKTVHQPDNEALRFFLNKNQITPTYTIGHLR